MGRGLRLDSHNPAWPGPVRPGLARPKPAQRFFCLAREMRLDQLARWTSLVAIGSVLYVHGSRGLRGQPAPPPRGIYSALLVAAIIGFVWLALHKSFWFPETSSIQLPPHVLQFDRKPEAGMVVATDAAATVAVADPNAVAVIYWSADPAPKMTLFADELRPDASFETMTNGGVARVVNRAATLTFRCPRAVSVLGFKLPKRVQYRVVYRSGRLSEVKAFTVAC